MIKSNFVSPIYSIKRIPVEQIVAQKINPNALDKKSFYALQMSIFNSGFTSCPTGCENEDFDPNAENSFDKIEKILRHIEGSDEDERSGGQYLNFATNISDPEFRKCFRYELIDGAQRTGIIRLGTYYMLTDKNADKIAEKWSKGEEIPNKPGKRMLMYIAWRENFEVPMSMNQNKNEIQKMSITVLSNVAKGEHDFKTIKEIICKLIDRGTSKEWISQNMFIDIDAIDKIIQINGIANTFKDYDEDESWVPEEDETFITKEDCYLDRQALKYLQDYIEKNRDKIINSGVKDIEEWSRINGKKN